MEQWNVRAPLLYLWSHRDWTDKHNAIAQEHGHVPSQHDALMEKSFDEVSPADHTMDGNHGDNLILVHDLLKPDDDPEGGWASRNEGQKENLSLSNLDDENQVVQEQSISKSDKTSRKKQHTEENDGRGCDVVSPANKQAVNDTYDRVLQRNQPEVFDGRSSVGFQSKPVISSSHVGVNDNAYGHYQPSSSSHMEFGTAVGGTQNWLSVASPLCNYGARNMEEQHSSFLGDGTSSFGYRPYIREEGKYWGELDIRQQIRIYGIQEPDYMRSSYLSGDDPAYGPMGTSYGQLGSDPRSSYMNTSAMQRYAPRLDESNRVRMRTLRSEPPTVGRNDNFERSVPPQPGYGSAPLGFTPDPHHAYSRHHSAGWLNE